MKKQIPGPHLIRQVWDPNQEFAFPSHSKVLRLLKMPGELQPEMSGSQPWLCARLAREGRNDLKGCAGPRTRDSPRLGPKLTCGIAPRILGVSQI